nr:MAG TPA_asm: hypothetical protein [Caudoviricetes sp.]
MPDGQHEENGKYPQGLRQIHYGAGLVKSQVFCQKAPCQRLVQ